MSEIRRVVRGGSFHRGHRSTRCAFCLENNPGDLSKDQGFRVVVREENG